MNRIKETQEAKLRSGLKKHPHTKWGKGHANHSAQKDRNWYASAAVEFEEHRRECAGAYGRGLKESIARFMSDDETSTAAPSETSSCEWYVQMMESLNDEAADD